MEILNFPRVHTGYQDKEERSVCAGCGSYYVVQPDQLKQAQEITDDLVGALNGLLEGSEIAPQQSDEPTRVWQRATPSEEAILAAFKALAKAE